MQYGTSTVLGALLLVINTTNLVFYTSVSDEMYV